MVASLSPTTEVVATAWLKSLGLANAGAVLPADRSSWATAGFVQATIAGGCPDLYSRLVKPVMQLDFYAVNPNSDKSPWGKANSLVELVRNATWNQPSYEVTLTLPGNYKPARVLAAYFLSEPRRINDTAQDNSGYARYSGDLQIVWTPA